ncbi:MAG TPA: hypothetical protein PLL09_00860 [Flavobacterium sp.]|uniref:hypothetical protein n=1 Tax=unclassified Flavobacterium TaxID=196869 RepID=UPI0025BC2274|nr:MULTISPECIES: hypothetical protein [unclassified Flavobacterium]HRE76351.1 hypothetical protein [Flavobacterium sp.]
MIKNLKSLFFVFFLFVNSCISISQTDAQGSAKKDKDFPFAKVYGERIEIIQDTTLLKQKLKENISFDKPIHFDSVEIVKQKTIGDLQEEYYFVLIKDSRSKVRIARWLKLIGDELYFNNKTNQVNSFEQTYLICVGNNDCYPEVFIFNDQKNWGCSKDPKCITDPEKREALNCDIYKTVLISELKD